jgi:hypothetical protein
MDEASIHQHWQRFCTPMRLSKDGKSMEVLEVQQSACTFACCSNQRAASADPDIVSELRECLDACILDRRLSQQGERIPTRLALNLAKAKVTEVVNEHLEHRESLRSFLMQYLRRGSTDEIYRTLALLGALLGAEDWWGYADIHQWRQHKRIFPAMQAHSKRYQHLRVGDPFDDLVYDTKTIVSLVFNSFVTREICILSTGKIELAIGWHATAICKAQFTTRFYPTLKEPEMIVPEPGLVVRQSAELDSDVITWLLPGEKVKLIGTDAPMDQQIRRIDIPYCGPICETAGQGWITVPPLPVSEEGVPPQPASGSDVTANFTRTHSHSLGGVSGGGHTGPLAPASHCAFASLRFDGVVPLEAEKLRVLLKGRGVSLEIINMKAGGDIEAAVIRGIEHCDTFIVFGSATYGEDTGNQACTYYESKYAQDRKKRIILIRMISFDQDFEFPQARFMFGLNKLVLPWMLGTPMPADLVDKIVEAMELDHPPAAAALTGV